MGILKHIIGFISSSRDESYLFWSQLLGVKPRNLNLYNQALQHASLSAKIEDTNERLEFLGDAVLDMVVADLLYEQNPTATEGEMTQRRAEIVKRKNLNALADRIGLTQRVKCRENLGGENLGGNALEAVVGAIYKDRGYKAARAFVKATIFDAHHLVEHYTESKQNLAVWCQKNNKQLEYKLLKEERLADNKHLFVVAVVVDGVEVSQAVGQNKREAQRHAAEQALKRIRRKYSNSDNSNNQRATA